MVGPRELYGLAIGLLIIGGLPITVEGLQKLWHRLPTSSLAVAQPIPPEWRGVTYSYRDTSTTVHVIGPRPRSRRPGSLRTAPSREDVTASQRRQVHSRGDRKRSERGSGLAGLTPR